MDLCTSTCTGTFKAVNARKLDRYVAALCKEHDITRIVAPGRGHAHVKTRTIQHPPIRAADLMTYFVALHEIGHILVGLSGTRLEREAACWRYALDVALIEPHFSIRQRICACLVRYLWRAQGRGWKIPAPDHDYWRLMEWWLLQDADLDALQRRRGVHPHSYRISPPA